MSVQRTPLPAGRPLAPINPQADASGVNPVNTSAPGFTPSDKTETPSNTSRTTSPSTSEDDDNPPSPWRHGPGNFVANDWVLVDQMGDEAEARILKPVPKRVVVEHPKHRAPPKGQADGSFEYVVFVPSWTDPELVEPAVLTRGEQAFGKGLADTHVVIGDTTQTSRPAVLPKDMHRNPTPYALRYGMHPFAPEGRSRLSPPVSLTRRVGLAQPIQTPEGPKHYLDPAGGEALQREFEADARNRGVDPATVSFKEYVDKLSQNQDTFPDIYRAALELHDLIEEDEDYQRLVFRNVTTSQIAANKSHSVEDDFGVGVDLNAPLHELVRRERWEDTNLRGASPDEPRFMYNIMGRRGEYSASNEELWMVLQPSLQLVSQILRCNHPFWLAALDLYCRRRVKVSRVPMNSKGKRPALVATWPDRNHEGMGRYTKELLAMGFDGIKAVSSFLAERLELRIGSADWDSQDMSKRTWGIRPWGETGYGSYAIESPAAQINVLIQGEIIWPLLVPTYTAAEKASVSFAIATVLLHEFAHAAVNAHDSLYRKVVDNYQQVQQLQHLDLEGARALERAVGETWCHRIEPYWRNEALCEFGEAFEDNLWGGYVDTLVNTRNGRMFQHHQFSAFALALASWPSNNVLPHWPKGMQLLNPPVPLDQHFTLMKMPELGAVFQTAFWNNRYVKFGHACLKMNYPTPPLTTANVFFRHRDKKRVFGDVASRWMRCAYTKLIRARESVLAKYLRDLEDDTMSYLLTRKRWHHHAKYWERARKELAEAEADLTMGEREVVLAVLDFQQTHEERLVKLATDPTVGPGVIDIDTYGRQLQNALASALKAVLPLYLEVQRVCLMSVQRCHNHIIEYVELQPVDRVMLHDRYGKYLKLIFETNYRQTMLEVEANLKELLDTLAKLNIGDDDKAYMNETINDLLQRVQMTSNHIVTVIKYLEADPLGEFLTTTPLYRSVGMHNHRRLLDVGQRAAIREMARAPPPIKAVVEKFLEILGESKKLQQDKHSLDRAIEIRMKATLENQQREPRGLNIFKYTPPTAATSTEPPPPFLQPQVIPTPTPSAPAAPGSNVNPGPAFGVTDVVQPTPTLDPNNPAFMPTTDPLTGFQLYATDHSPFGVLWAPDDWLMSGTQQAGPFGGQRNQPLAPAPAAWQPFGTPYSVVTTVSDDLARAGVNVNELQGVFGGDVYMRQKLEAQKHKGKGKGPQQP